MGLTCKTHFISPAAGSAHKKQGPGLFFSLNTCINITRVLPVGGRMEPVPLQLSASFLQRYYVEPQHCTYPDHILLLFVGFSRKCGMCKMDLLSLWLLVIVHEQVGNI